MGMAMGIMSLLSSLIAIVTIATVSAGDSDDKATLLAFKAQVSHGGPSTLASWNGSTNLCSWEGVACSRRRPTRVVALSLYGSGLTGALSPAVGNLTFLQTLNLSSNGLNGEIPASLGRLRSLQTLDLSSNWLNGEIPVSLGRLRRLQTLDLSYNSLSSTFPVNLSSCISMIIMIARNLLPRATVFSLLPHAAASCMTHRAIDGLQHLSPRNFVFPLSTD